MILTYRKIYLVSIIFFCFLLSVILAFLVVLPNIGNPIAAYWGLIFFLSITALLLFIREIIAGGIISPNSFPYFLGIVVFSPVIFTLISFLVKHINIDDKTADSIFTAKVISLEESPEYFGYKVAKFSVINELKVPINNLELEKFGIILPENCAIQLKIDEDYLIYLVEIMGVNTISCKASRKLDNESKYEGLKNAVAG